MGLIIKHLPGAGIGGRGGPLTELRLQLPSCPEPTSAPVTSPSPPRRGGGWRVGAGSLQEHWASPLFPSALAASTHGGTLWPPPPPQSSTLVLVATLSSASGLPEDPRQALLTVPPLWSVPSPSSHLPPDCPRSVPSQPPAPVPLAPPALLLVIVLPPRCDPEL